MVNEDSLNDMINSAQKHYSSMFFLPTYKKALLAIAVICIGVIGLSSLIFYPSTEGLIGSLSLGISLFLVTYIMDILLSKIILKDPIYILRRAVALSLFCWIVWLFFILLGVVIGAFYGPIWWIRLCLLGFASVLTFRTTVFIATSRTSIYRRLASSLLQPVFCIIVFTAFWFVSSNSIIPQFWPYLIISPIIACVSAYLFLLPIDRVGYQVYGWASLPIFRAFMLDWVVNQNAPLEEFFEKIGETTDVEVNLLKFDSYKPKAAIIMPLVHPGPFKNVGSSVLPSLLKHEFEKAFSCDTCVPLGILGHELDLASQEQNIKIINHIIESAKFSASDDTATPLVKVKENYAVASCQIFGKSALLSFTLAPKTTEDLPQELGRMVREEAKKLGLTCTMIINSHNSINDVIDTAESLGDLEIAASKCLKKAVTMPTHKFKVGSATVYPSEFSVKEGMGPGGITAIVVQVEQQKAAYTIIDGNNMISGLHEKIIPALAAAGFDESEVFTTDTHVVSAVITGNRGYNPVGEAMNHEVLIKYITDVAKAAEANMEESKAGCLSLTVPNVRVIGKEMIGSLSLLVDKALKKAKQTILPVFGLEGLLLILLLVLL